MLDNLLNQATMYAMNHTPDRLQPLFAKAYEAALLFNGISPHYNSTGGAQENICRVPNDPSTWDFVRSYPESYGCNNIQAQYEILKHQFNNGIVDIQAQYQQAVQMCQQIEAFFSTPGGKILGGGLVLVGAGVFAMMTLSTLGTRGAMRSTSNRKF
jgi:hypothetical protein